MTCAQWNPPLHIPNQTNRHTSAALAIVQQVWGNKTGKLMLKGDNLKSGGELRASSCSLKSQSEISFLSPNTSRDWKPLTRGKKLPNWKQQYMFLLAKSQSDGVSSQQRKLLNLRGLWFVKVQHLFAANFTADVSLTGEICDEKSFTFYFLHEISHKTVVLWCKKIYARTKLLINIFSTYSGWWNRWFTIAKMYDIQIVSDLRSFTVKPQKQFL